MPDMHVQYHSASGKRPILIASADEKDFETLHDILEDKFVILRASDYEDALQKIDKNLNTLGLVILDHELPDNAGPDLLKRIKNNPDTNRIPVIVISSDHQAEADSLSGGAAEFISMPLPPSVVLLTRIQHAIELCEIRDVIKWTERDKLSGLYNRDYFYRYCQQYDLHHPEIPMDALVIDVNHFHLLIERPYFILRAAYSVFE